MSLARGDGRDSQDATRAQRAAFDQFFLAVERKAFRIAQLALRHEDDALDAVQDSMLQLVRAYAARPQAEWKPLFYRILENRIRDLQRRRTVRGRVFAWWPARGGNARDDGDAEAEIDPAANAPSPEAGPQARLETEQAMALLEEFLAQLPARQRQAFLLRNFEELDVAGTAAAMGCSEGSVKTHYFRAVHTLRARLGAEQGEVAS
ncbi:MAG: RNA polymerase sigma factor [Steroidobacteraceae bacterium]